MKTIVLILITSICLFSCSQGGKTQSKLAVTVGSLASPNLENYRNGGAILYGYNNTSGERFAINLIDAQSAIDLELANGAWIFYGFLWDGAQRFTGNNYCAFSAVSLTGGDISIPINFSNQACANGEFSQNPLITTNATGVGVSFPLLEIEGCRHLTNISNEYSICDKMYGDEGLMLSYRVKLRTMSDGTFSMGGALVSECLDASTNGAYKSTALRLPQGNGILPLEIEIESFFGANCSNAQGSLISVYPNGTPADEVLNQQGSRIYGYLDSSQEYTKIFHPVSEQEACSFSVVNPNTAFSTGNGSEALPYGLCFPHQWKLIGRDASGNITSTRLGNSYELLRDIDFSNSVAGTPFNADDAPPVGCVRTGGSFTPVGDNLKIDYPTCSGGAAQNFTSSASFTGNFNGNGHVIANAFAFNDDYSDMGLFRSVDGATIKNLRLKNIEIEGNGRVGIIAGKVKMTIDDTYIQDIFILDSHIEGDEDAGSLVGHIENSASYAFFTNNIVAHNVSLRGRGDNIGGLVGVSKGTFDGERLYFHGSINIDHNGSSSAEHIGGLVGSLEGDTSFVKESTSKGAITGRVKKAGGIVGNIVAPVTPATVLNVSSEMAIVTQESSDFIYLGGIAGNVTSGGITNSFFSGSITASCFSATPSDCHIGEVAGSLSGGSLSSVFASGDFSSSFGGYATGATTLAVAQMYPATFNDITLGGNAVWTKAVGRVPRLGWLDTSPLSEVDECTKPLSLLSVSGQVTAGRGAEFDPVVICTLDQFGPDLNGFTGHVVLGDSLNLVSHGDQNFTRQIVSFDGVLDGQGYLLHGLRVAGVLKDDSALILDNNGTIKNIKMVGMNLDLSSSAETAAILAVNNNASIEDVEADSLFIGSASGTGVDDIGLIASINGGTIKEIRLSGNIRLQTGGESVGGIVGENNGFISKVESNASIELGGTSAVYDHIGGVVGHSTSGSTISESAWYGFLQAHADNMGLSQYIGGIVGLAEGTALANLMVGEYSMIRSGNSDYVGGIAGSIKSSSVLERSYSAAEVTLGYCTSAPGTFINKTDCVGNSGSWNLPSTPANFGAIVGEQAGSGISADTFYLADAYQIIDSPRQIASSSLRSDNLGNITASGDHCLITTTNTFSATVDESSQFLFIDGHTNYYDIVTEVTASQSFAIDLNEATIFPSGECANLDGAMATLVDPSGVNNYGTRKYAPEMLVQTTYCPSAPASQTDPSFQCSAGEWDMVEDSPDPSSNGFERLLEFYIGTLIPGYQSTLPPPVWTLEPGGNDFPRLAFD